MAEDELSKGQAEVCHSKERSSPRSEEVKNAWFQQKAGEVERAMNGGRGMWKGLRDIQRGRAGLRPVRSRAIRDHDGNLCTDQDGALQRWHEHFQTILNTRSSFVESDILAAKQYPV